MCWADSIVMPFVVSFVVLNALQCVAFRHKICIVCLEMTLKAILFFFEHTLPTVKPVNNNSSNTTTTTTTTIIIIIIIIQLTLLIIIYVFRVLWLSKRHERNMNDSTGRWFILFHLIGSCIITFKSLFFHNLITSARETIATFRAREITELGNRHM